MPGVIIGAIIKTAVTSALTTALGATLAGIIGAAAGAIVGGLISAAVRGKPDGPRRPTAPTSIESMVSPISPRQVVYGRVKTGGALVFAGVPSVNGTGRLTRVLAVAAHEVDLIERVYFADQVLYDHVTGYNTTSYFGTSFGVTINTGSPAQDVSLAAEFASYDYGILPTDKFAGIACVIATCFKSEDAETANNEYPHGLPPIAIIVRGKKDLYDPRDDSVGYSTNPILVLMDFLLNYVDKSLSLDDFDLPSFSTAAHICDQDVPLADGSTEKKYSFNGVIFLDFDDALPIIEAILSSCGGSLWISGGLIKVRVAAASPDVVVDFDENDYISALSVVPSIGRDQSFNSVGGKYTNPVTWLSDEIPQQFSQSYRDADLEERWAYLELPFTKSPATAQRIARMVLLASRQEISVAFKVPFTGLILEPNDLITLTCANLGWDAKQFLVSKWSFDAELNVQITAVEEDASVYEWSTDLEQVVDLTPATNLVITIDLPPSIKTITESVKQISIDGLVSQVDITINPATPAYNIAMYQIQYSTDQANWTSVTSLGVNVTIPSINAGIYYFRTRAKSIFGNYSDWSTSTSFEVFAFSAPPAPPTNFTMRSLNGSALASWDLTNDLDVKIGGAFELRYSSSTTETAVGNSIVVMTGQGRSTTASLPLLGGTYWLQFIDIVGNYSTAVRFKFGAAEMDPLPIAVLIEENPAFAGVKDNCVVIDDVLQIDAAIEFDDIPDVDDVVDIDTAGGVVSTATYYWDGIHDFGSVTSFVADLHIVANSFGALVDFDEVPDVDLIPDVDGSTSNQTNVATYISTTDDDPSTSPAVWSDYIPLTSGTYSARGIRFKSILQSYDLSSVIQVSELAVKIRL